jgi:hypothetical protein
MFAISHSSHKKEWDAEENRPDFLHIEEPTEARPHLPAFNSSRKQMKGQAAC